MVGGGGCGEGEAPDATRGGGSSRPSTAGEGGAVSKRRRVGLEKMWGVAVEGGAEAEEERMWIDAVREGSRARRSWERGGFKALRGADGGGRGLRGGGGTRRNKRGRQQQPNWHHTCNATLQSHCILGQQG